MGYSSIVEFTKDFEATWSQDGGGNHVMTAWRVYLNGLKQGIESGGASIGLIENLQKLLKEQGSVFDGGKIFVDQSSRNRWRIFLNDCFILGGVHSTGPFTLVGLDQIVDHASMVQKEGQLDYVKDPNSQYPLKVTQREVLGITSFGYSGGDIEEGKRVFTCTGDLHQTLARTARLSTYKEIVGDFEAALK